MSTLVAWQWWIIGMALIISEAFIPFFFLMWIGLVAVLIGSVTYIKPSLEGTTAFLLFALVSGIFSCIAIPLGYKKGEKNKKPPVVPTKKISNETIEKNLRKDSKKPDKSVKVKILPAKKKKSFSEIEENAKKQLKEQALNTIKKASIKSKNMKKNNKT